MADFNVVERELREIEDDFNCGRMNAFGSAVVHEEILREMKKVNELEIQVFYRSCEQIAAGLDDEAAVQRTINEHLAMAKADGGQSGPGGSAGANVPSTPSASAAAAPNTPSSSVRLGADGGSQSETQGLASVGRDALRAQSIVRLSDASFAEIGKLFRSREVSLRAVGDNLRQMAKHVATVNELVQRAHGASFGTE